MHTRVTVHNHSYSSRLYVPWHTYSNIHTPLIALHLPSSPSRRPPPFSFKVRRPSLEAGPEQVHEGADLHVQVLPVVPRVLHEIHHTPGVPHDGHPRRQLLQLGQKGERAHGEWFDVSNGDASLTVTVSRGHEATRPSFAPFKVLNIACVHPNHLTSSSDTLFHSPAALHPLSHPTPHPHP